MKNLVIVLFILIVGSAKAQQYKDTIYINTDRTTIIQVAGNTAFVNSIEIPKSTLDPKNTRGKLIYYKADDLDDNGSRIYRLKAIRPFSELVYGTIISDDGLNFVIKYSDTITRSYYKITLKTAPPAVEEKKSIDKEEEPLTTKTISYTSKQIVSFENAKTNIVDCFKANKYVFYSVKKAYIDKDLIFIKLKISNKSLKDFSPDDLQISIKDNVAPVNFRTSDFVFNVIKPQSSVEGTIIIANNNISIDDDLIISIKELTNGRDADLNLPVKQIQTLPILKSK